MRGRDPGRARLRAEDRELLDRFAHVHLVLEGGDTREAMVGLLALEAHVAERLADLAAQASAVADANARSVEIMEGIDALAEDLRKQNEDLTAQNLRIEEARRELEEQAAAAAEANVEALFAVEESEGRVVEMTASQEELARRRAELEIEAAALAAANAQAVEVLEEKEEALSRLENRANLLEKSRRELEEKAFVDEVTGLFNHRYFRENMRLELARAQRYGRALTLVFLDLDLFKRINDVHGHPTGDKVLRAVADVVHAAVRAADIPIRMGVNPFAARYGGEEFVVILPETASEGGALVAERVRERVAACRLTDVEGAAIPSITISGGVATLNPDESLESLVERADQALYRAKQAGRDQIVVAPDSSGAPDPSSRARPPLRGDQQL